MRCGAQWDAVLGPFGAGDRRLDGAQVQFDGLRVRRFVVWLVPQALFLGVGLDQLDLVFGSAGQPQVVQGDVVDGEDGDVAPYSGLMLPMVARLASGTLATPGP